MKMSHAETKELVHLQRERAARKASAFEGLSVEPTANVHLMGDGSAFVECRLRVGPPGEDKDALR